MASLFNTRISDTYVGLIKSLDNAVISTTLKQLSDGSGNSLGIYVNTSGDFKVTGILEWGSLKDTGEDITITKFVDEADGIANNDNDTTIPTTAAIIDYVASRITLEDLDFSGDTGTGSVDLDSQTFAIVGTTNEIETSATGQTLTIGLPNNVTITGETSVGSLKTSGVYYFNGNTISHLSNSDLIFGFKSTTGFRVSTNGGLTDDILIASGSISGNLILDEDNMASNSATKLATQQSIKAYVDSQVTAQDLDFGGDTGTGSVDLDSQSLSITGTTNQVTTSATGQTLNISLPSTIHRNLQGNVTGDLTGNVTATSVLADGVTATTQSQGDNSTKIATTSYVDSAIGNNNELSEVLANGNTTGGTDIAVSAGDDITFTDTSKALFGNSSVLQIYHDGSNSYIKEAGTGNLILNANNFRIEDNLTNPYLFATAGAEVTIYHNGSPKLATTSTGISVTGVAVADGLDLGDNEKIRLGASQDLEIYHDGSNSYIKDTGTGDLRIWADSPNISTASGNKIFFGNNGAAELYYTGGAKKFETTSAGVTVTGSATISSDLILSDYGSGTHTGTATQRLGVDSSGNVIEIPIGAGAVDGSGTANTVTKWSDTDTITDSIITDNGSVVTFSTFGDISTNGFKLTGSSTYYRINNGGNSGLWNEGNYALQFGTNNVERMRLDSNGQLGLGVVPPSDAHATWSQFFLGEKGSLISEKLNTGGIYGMYITDNLYLDNDTGNFAYITTDEASAYRQEAGQHQFYTVASGTAGAAASLTERLRIDNGGQAIFYGDVTLDSDSTKLKIGDSQDLQLYHDGFHSFIDNNTGTLYLRDTSASGSILLRNSNGGDIQFDNEFAGNILFNTSNIERARFDSSGRLGLGTSSPSNDVSGLHIAVASSTDQLYLERTGSGTGKWWLGTANNSLYFQDDVANSTRMVINSSGNLGLGTTSVTSGMRLDVQGGDFRVGDDANQGFEAGWSAGAGVVFLQGYNRGTSSFLDMKFNNAVTITAGGSLGIGTTSPGAKLDIHTATNTNGILIKEDTDDTITHNFYIDGSDNGVAVLYADGQSAKIQLNTNGVSYFNGGSVAIGTTLPNTKLDVNSGISSSTSNVISISQNTTGAIKQAVAFGVAIQNGGEATNASDLTISTASGGSLSERARITSSGKLLVGITSGGTFDVAKIQGTNSVANDFTLIGPTASQVRINFGDTDASQQGEIGYDNNEDSMRIVTNGLERMRITSDGSLQYKTAGGKGYDFGASGSSASVANMFCPSGFTLAFGTNNSERVRITSGGDVLVGTTSVNGTGGITIRSNASGGSNGAGRILFNRADTTATSNVIEFNNNGSAVGGIEYTNTATAYNTSSDYRLKEDLQDFNALEIASKIKMYDFKWKADDSRSYGVMAHELEEVLPQAVTGEKDAEEMQGVDYSKLVPILLKSIQELEARVKELENK